MMERNLRYDIEFPREVDEILDEDFFVFENLSGEMMESVSEPIKFSSTVTIFVKKGSFRASINLNKYTFRAPCMVNIRAGQILQKDYVSPDFAASFLVMSKRMADNLIIAINNPRIMTLISRYPVATVEEQYVESFELLYRTLKKLTDDSSNPHRYEAILHFIIAFYYAVAERCFMLTEAQNQQPNHICSAFLNLVQTNYKEHRFLGYYAEQLGVSPKHLSRMVKNATGYSGPEWIENHVLLEAKVLLRSSILTIQQISDELCFPSQSFFGKYFKKRVGLTPKEFRNRK